MAKLSHPNVAAVYDVEDLEHGEIVLVMEYVAGRTLSTWLQRARPWRQVVACFRRAGRGLAAAHDAGLSHGDFGTDHVLVGDDGRARVTDFGLARALAPERRVDAARAALDDQLAFCTALHRALAGTPRLPARLVATIARGLADDPRERWPDMHALLAALGRDAAPRRRTPLLFAGTAGVLVLAAIGVQTSIVRAERCAAADASAHLHDAWAARRDEVRGAVLGIGAAYAGDVWTRTERALDDYAEAWAHMHVDTCTATTIRGEQSSAVMDLRMACLQRAEAQLGAVTQVLAHADAQTVQRAHTVIATLRPLDRCADVDALRAEVEPPLPEQREAVEQLRGAVALATAARKAGRYEEAGHALDLADELYRAVDYGPVHAELAIERGALLDHTGKYDEARQVLQQGLQSAARWRQSDELEDAASWLLLVVGYQLRRADEGLRYVDVVRGLADGDPHGEARLSSHLAAVLEAQGEYAEAVTEQRHALALLEQVDPDAPDVAKTRVNLANVLRAQGEYEAAVVEYRGALSVQSAALGPEHPDTAGTRHNLAVALFAQGKHAEAEAEHRLALAALEPAIGRDHPHVAILRNNLANALFAQREHDAAEAEIRRAIEIQEHTLGTAHPDVAMSRNSLAAVLDAKGEGDAAEVEYRRALEIEEIAAGPGHPDTAQFRHNLALALAARGKRVEAEAEHRRALADLERGLGSQHPHVAASRVNLASLLLVRGANAEARQLAQTAWDRLQQDDAPPALAAPSAAVLAQASWEDGDAAAKARALELAERALAIYAEAGLADGKDALEVRTWISTHGG